MLLGDVLDDDKAKSRPAKRTASVLVERLLRMSDELESVSDEAATILNAYERVRAYYLNIAETLAGGKGN